MSQSSLFLVVFLACVVEAVEALTIVLAAGMTRGWRSAGLGCAAGLLCLVAIVAALGPALGVIPLDALRLFVGTLLLIFGLQWLRKAILRASGNKALHDEAAAFDEAFAAAARASPQRDRMMDWYGFTLAFKALTLEGLEVAFIALTFGANQHNIPLAALAAVAAAVVVAVAGVAVRAPLTRVPENMMKFIVGVLLTAFGVFWSTEGVGVHWPAADAALLVIIAVVGLYALALVAVFRRSRRRACEGVER